MVHLRTERSRRWPVPLLLLSGFLLLSMGGAVVAAPVTVPLGVVAAHQDPRYRWPVAAVGGLTVTEAVWALTYVLLGEQRPWIVALPGLAGVGFAAGVFGMRAGFFRESLASDMPRG